MGDQDTPITGGTAAKKDSNGNPGLIRFIARHRPTLPVGNYKITMSQRIDISGKKPQQEVLTFPDRYVAIRGERFSLKADWIQSVFPPQGGLGDYENCLPHIVITPGTLPWERTADRRGEGEKRVPWLALLVLDDPEAALIRSETVLLKDLGQVGKQGLLDNLETGESPADGCRVIGIPAALIEKLMPAKEDLKYLAHIRQVNDSRKETYDPKSPQSDYAVVAGNRLLTGGKEYMAYLVSLEGYYDDRRHSWFGTDENGLTWLVCLKSWGFRVKGYYQLTDSVLAALAAGQVPAEVVEKLQLLKDTKYERRHSFLIDLGSKLDKSEQNQYQELVLEKARHVLNFRKLLLDLTTGAFRAPPSKSARAEVFLDKGYTLLPHALRQGDRTLSLYRGPFIPCPQASEKLPLPAVHADQLLRYDSANGLFDVSYAAAWQLGRLLSLQNRSYTSSLMQWKEWRIRRNILEARSKEIHDTLGDIRSSPAREGDPLEADLQEDLAEWLGQLKLTQPIPLNYLVQDPLMLPPGSLRFFMVDRNWIDCLIDGACSIGRFTREDAASDTQRAENLAQAADRVAAAAREMAGEAPGDPGTLSGIILRSEVIVHWPGLEIDGYARTEEPLPIYHMQTLATDILVCLFKGTIDRLNIHHPPEGLHFGVDADGLTKRPRKRLDGERLEKPIDVAFRFEKERIVNAKDTADHLSSALKNIGDAPETFNAGEFAFQMIESSHSVQFRHNSEAP